MYLYLGCAHHWKYFNSTGPFFLRWSVIYLLREVLKLLLLCNIAFFRFRIRKSSHFSEFSISSVCFVFKQKQFPKICSLKSYLFLPVVAPFLKKLQNLTLIWFPCCYRHCCNELPNSKIEGADQKAKLTEERHLHKIWRYRSPLHMK